MAPPSMDSSFRHQDDDDAFYKPPNFDHFLNQRQHQRRPNRSSRSMNADDFSQSNKANDASSARPNLGNARIHPTEMQRYLQGLMNNQNNQLPSSSSGSNSNISKVEMLHRLKASLDNGSDPSMVGLSSLNNGINNNNNFGYGGGSSSQQVSSGNNGGIKNEPNSNNENKNNGNNSSNNDNSNNSSNNNNQNNNIKRGGNDNLASSFGGIPPSDAGIKNSRQKNDKAVEVHHKDKVIARFRTQTECARYLRATPEAVSYHCSKGGGICNGLVIKPLGASDVAALLSPDRGAQGVDDLPTPRGPCFGLLEGAERFRPKERPQLKPETVAILREWLLSPEHMDNPYPNLRESERLMERTGLDKTQLKHWFNNARKRILKPLLKNGGKKGAPGLGSPSLQEQAGPPKKRGTGGSGSMGPRKKRKNKDDNDGGGSNPSSGAASELGGGLEATTALCGTINSASSNDTNVMSNMSSSHQRQQQMLFEEKRQFELMHQQLLSEERQRIRPRQFDDPFMDNNNLNRGNSDGNGSFNSSGSGNNMMSMNRYERLMGYNNNGMSNMMSQGMMGFGDSMGGMLNDCTPRNSFNDDCGGSSFMRGGGGFQGRGNNMGGMGIGFNGCMEVNDSNNLYDRFSEFSSSRMNRQGFNQDRFNQGFQQDRFNQDRFTQERFNQGLQQERFNQIFNQDGRMNNGDSSPYCQPLHGGSQGNQNLGDPRDASAMPENSTRSNAVFKQQVATMAMNEASTAFEDMEDAFAHAKGILAAARTKRPGSPSVGDPAEDPLVIEANARAKKCQSVAMFKLKVSQRASEEAANAYEGYQRMVDGMGGGAGGGGGSGGVGPEFSL